MQLLLESRQALVPDSDSPVTRALPDPARRNRMVTETLWLVRSIAAALLRDHHFSISQEDLESYGKCGLLEAADSFDYRTGTRFNTFAYYRIRGAMLDAIRYGAGQCTRTEMRSIRRRRSLRDRVAVGAPHMRAERDQPLERLTIIDHELAHASAQRARCHEGEALTPEQLLEHNRIIERVRAAIAALPVRDRRVVELLYYRREGSFKAVAKYLGTSQSYIFRIHTRVLEQLRDALAELAS
jgi:RNA polymerase sigma factor for flagellar operon FliA